MLLAPVAGMVLLIAGVGLLLKLILLLANIALLPLKLAIGGIGAIMGLGAAVCALPLAALTGIFLLLALVAVGAVLLFRLLL